MSTFKFKNLSAWFIFLTGTFLTSVLLTGCNQDEKASTTETSKALSPGQQIFLNHCMGCHMGAGDPPGPNDIILSSQKLTSESNFIAFVRNPNNGAMPAFTPEQIADADLHQLYEYVSGIKKN